MTNDLIIRVKYEGVTYDLDVLNEVPLRVDLSALEAQELGKVFGIGTQTFSLPGTKKNNRFFKHGYDIGADDVPGFYEPIDAWVIQNGETLLYGGLSLMEIVASEDGWVDYKVQITDKAVQFVDSLTGKYLADADWSAYEHTLSSGSIVDSWNDNLLGGSVYYPLIDYGRDDKTPYPQTPRIQFSSSSLGTQIGAIDNVNSPLRAQQLLPAIRTKDVVDVIFDQVGFRYTGSFIESADFQNLYMLTKPNDEFGLNIPSASATFSAVKTTATQLSLDTGFITLPVNTEISDPLNAYNSGTSTYSAQDNGATTFEGTVTFFNPNTTPTGASILTLQLRVGSLSAYTIVDTATYYLDYVGTTGYGPFTIGVNGTVNMSGGIDDAWLAVAYLTDFGTPGTPIPLTGGTFKCTQAPKTFEGATVDMSLQFNKELKSEDVINGLINQFNLVLTPSADDQSTIQIETVDDWIRSGSVKDWTHKYDTSKRVSISSTINDLSKTVFFQNAEDTDRFSSVAKEQEPYKQYGTLQAVASSKGPRGETTIQPVFAPTIVGSPIEFEATGSDGKLTFELDLDSPVVLPHLYKLNNSKQEAYAFKPRLGYKVSNTLNSNRIYIGNTGAYETVTSSYATMANTNSLPVTTGVTKDLHFNNTYGLFSQAGLNFNNGVNNFEAYWKTYYDSLYWDGSKKVTLDIQFDPHEYKDIQAE